MKRARPRHRLSAPNARQLLARIPRDDIFGEGIELRDIRRGFAGMAPAILARLSCSGGEAILQDGECIDYVTTCGYAHHLQQSMAPGYLTNELAVAGSALEVEINGKMYAARVVGAPRYDPTGVRMRGRPWRSLWYQESSTRKPTAARRESCLCHEHLTARRTS